MVGTGNIFKIKKGSNITTPFVSKKQQRRFRTSCL